MDISVIICTYNRSESLGTTLESVAASTLRDGAEWEILVVDNNSRDRTRKVVEEFSQRYPGRFRYLFEPRQGKSYALNTGVQESFGGVLAFTDDDVTVEPTWLQNLTAGLDGGAWAGAAGRILPAQAFGNPPWFSLDGPQGLGGPLCGFFDLGDRPCEMDRPPYGANMAFRKCMFEKYSGFRRDLGAPSGDVVRGEDTELGTRLMAAGHSLRYEPSAVVYHPVDEKRLTKRYFLAWSFGYGRSMRRLKPKRPHVCGIPRDFISLPNMILLVLPRRAIRWTVATNPRKKFWEKCQVWAAAGEIAELWRVLFGPSGGTDAQPLDNRVGNA